MLDQRGVGSVILLIVVVVVLGVLGFWIVSHNMQSVSTLQTPVSQPQVHSSPIVASDVIQTGKLNLNLNTSSNNPTQTLNIVYDSQKISGTIMISDGSVVTNLKVFGTFNVTTGAINAKVEGTTNVSNIQSSTIKAVAAKYEGNLTGTVQKSGSSSGTLDLTQLLVSTNGGTFYPISSGFVAKSYSWSGMVTK